MLNVKTKLNFNKHEFVINYFEVETVTDFEYFIILLVNKAINENIDLEKLILEFTKGESDLALLIRKRFEVLFKVETDKYKEIEKMAKEMEELTRTLRPAIKKVMVPFYEEFNKYLFDEQWIEKQQLESIFEDKYSNNDYVFDKISINLIEDELIQRIDFKLNDDFETIDTLNLKNIHNDVTINKIKKELVEEAQEFLSFKVSEIMTIDKRKDNLDFINRNFGDKSQYIELFPFNKQLEQKTLEYDFGSDKKFILTEFIKYKGIPLIETKRFSYDKLREPEDIMDKLLELVKTKSDSLSKRFLEDFLINAKTKNELLVVKDTNLYSLNTRKSFNKINLMIETDVNIINDESIVFNEMFSYLKEDMPLQLYEYLNKFYGKDRFNGLTDKQKVSLIYYVYNNDSSVLNKVDNKFINDLLMSENLMANEIRSKILEISSLRSDIDKMRDWVSEQIKGLPEESTKRLGEFSLRKEKLDLFKRVANYCVHLRDIGKSFEKDHKAVKQYSPILVEIRNDLLDFEKNGYLNKEWDRNQISELVKINKEIKEALKK